MEEVRQLVQEEGREARNLVAFHVAVDTPAARISRKPPRVSPLPVSRRPRPPPARLRSASAGRDKRSELRARYWALLFGDLQRAIGEIYNTVEAHENLNECQEVILVLENYTRDFKALGEWFRLKWEYDNTPPPQRPQSLAWEIRKTDFVRPESRRAYSVRSSPSVSGKNSPSLSGHNTPSGKNSPNLTGKSSPGSGKISPRVSSGHSSTSPKANIEFFSSKIAASKITAKPEPRAAKETPRLSNIKEKDFKESPEDVDSKKEFVKFLNENLKPTIEIGIAKENPSASPIQVVIKSPKKSSEKHEKKSDEVSIQAKATIEKLEHMENEFLLKNITENKASNDNVLNKDLEKTEKVKKSSTVAVNGNVPSESPTKSEDNFADVSNGSSPQSSVDIPPVENEKENTKSEENVIEENETTKLKSPTTPINTLSHTKVCESVLMENAKKETVKKYAKEEVMVVSVGAITKQTTETDSKETLSKRELKEYVKESKPNQKKSDITEELRKDQDSKKAEAKVIIDTKPVKPAYSQAAAKPKPVSATKAEIKTPTRSTTTLIRSKTVVEIRPNPIPKPQRQFPKRNQTSKCSYPFNLTTGRTSLFDPGNKITVKRPINRNVTMASGDSKVQTKADATKRPPRPPSLKLNEKGDKKENHSPTLENIKDYEEYSSSDTMVTQIYISRIESSESLKTLVPDDLQMLEDVANSIEVLNVDNNKSDNEGWLTVKSRRLSRESKKQYKSHWANRFNQPSATTSLPTLNMLESPKQETKSILNSPTTAKFNRARSEQPQEAEKPEKVVKVAAKPKAESKPKDPAMIRQKSDVTGLRTRTSKNKVLSKKDKIKGATKDNDESDLKKNRLHSSLESLTTGLARSQESTTEVFDFDKWKAEFKSTFKYLDDDDQISNHNEILKAADPSEMSEIAEMTSQIEENERKISLALDFQSEVDQRKLCEEEDLLNRQIMELQQVSDIDLDTETDDTETDAEILCEDNTSAQPPTSDVSNLGALAASLEDQYETALAGMSWAERIDTLVVLEALVARDPGRAQQLHAKLSQGIKRRGSLQDALRRLQAKQARAERQRLEYRTERAKKIHQLLARVEEVKVAKNQLTEEKRLRMERRLQKAAENRDQHLKDIVRKAHDEEEKLREIAFIKQLEAENRRHEFLELCRSHTTRLRMMRRDRLSKLEQKAAREAAVGARRQALEAARRLHVETLLERRKERDARVEELKELKKQERDDAAREKAEGVKSRLSALAAAAELEADALRSRIRDKQDASQQRLESHLQAIREKATGPRQPTTSESQDQITRELEEEAAKMEQERKEKERLKSVKKKARKIKQKLLATSIETKSTEENAPYVDFNPMLNKIYKALHQLNNIISPLVAKNKSHEQAETKKTNEHTETQNGVEVTEESDKQKPKKKITNGDMKTENIDKKKSKKKKGNTEDANHNDATSNNDNNNAKLENILTDKPNELIKQDTDQPSINEEKPESNNNKKRKKSKNNNSDKSKLSKTSSVCSSLSDMSKVSGKSEKKTNVVIDMTFLERQLNELYRVADKVEKTYWGVGLCGYLTPSLFLPQSSNAQTLLCSCLKVKVAREITGTLENPGDRQMFQRCQGLRIIGQLVSLVAEREDIASQFSTRCLSTAMSVLSRAVGVCAVNANNFLRDNFAVHVIKLLSDQLDKDLHSDQREMCLAKQLCDCLSVTLDCVLCATRVHEERGTRDVEVLASLRTRAHTLISYICLSGCVSRAEKAGEARESVQTLLTVCADLCHPCEVDVGSDRTSAIQSLRCALGTSICGSRAELCMLFAQGAGLDHCSGFVKAARTAHLLRALAELDHQIVQDAFGEGGWPLEFRAAVSRLLTQHAPNDREAPRTAALRLSNQRLDQRLSETMVLDLIVLLGFVVVNNPQLQETICDGWSAIKTLCTLPANWLVSKPHCHDLLPTLIALSERPSVAAAMSSELNIKLLEEYLESADAQKVKLVQVIKQGRNRTCKK